LSRYLFCFHIVFSSLISHDIAEMAHFVFFFFFQLLITARKKLTVLDSLNADSKNRNTQRSRC